MDYWRRRMLDAQKRVTDKGIDALNKKLRQYYTKVMQRTIDDFEAVYDKVLANAEEGKQITPADLYNLDKYYKMQAQLRDRLQQLGDKSCNAMSAAFEDEYKQIYTSLIDGHISDAAWSTIDEQAAKQVAEQIWCADGKSWSQRVWGNVDELQQALNDSLIDCAIRGKKTTDLKAELMERFGVNYRRAETLVRTEMAHIETQGARDRYKKYGINKVQVLADTDSRTCPICANLDGKTYDINAKMPIPVHPNCRCCIVPVIDVKQEDSPFTTNTETAIIKPKGNFNQERLNLITSEFSKYGTAILPKNVIITHGGKHADKQLVKRGITIEDAQHYVNTAYICFQQSADKVMYLAEDGVAIVLDNGGLSTAYPKKCFDEAVKELLREVKRLWQK